MVNDRHTDVQVDSFGTNMCRLVLSGYFGKYTTEHFAYLSCELPNALMITLRDKLNQLFPSTLVAEGEDASLEATPIIRNPMALSDDALGEPGLHLPVPLADEVLNPSIHCAESVSQADGLGDDSLVPEVVE